MSDTNDGTTPPTGHGGSALSSQDTPPADPSSSSQSQAGTPKPAASGNPGAQPNNASSSPATDTPGNQPATPVPNNQDSSQALSDWQLRESKFQRPRFLDVASKAYRERGKKVLMLSGQNHDLYWCEQNKRFLGLEQTLQNALDSIFTVLTLDAASGLGCINQTDVTNLAQVCAKTGPATWDEKKKVSNLSAQMRLTRHDPLPAIELLHEVLYAVDEVRRNSQASATKPQPICTIIRFAGALFPSGDFDRLSEMNTQKLVTFLNLIESWWYNDSNHLIILIADTRAEVNSRIVSLPSVESIEIELPNDTERSQFTDHYTSTPAPDGKPRKVGFEKNVQAFVDDSNGLTLVALREMMEAARLSGKPIARKDVLAKTMEVIKAELGDLIKVKVVQHGVSDIVGYKAVGEKLAHTLKRCENPATAVSAILVSGPNGSGKTFTLEAHAADSNMMVFEMGTIRGKYYGEADAFLEKLRLRLRAYRKSMIMVPEADTQFSSVNKSDTHEAERRLNGGLIAFIGDTTNRGRVVWSLDTARPNQLDPDILRRAPVQIPILDLEGKEREDFVIALFKRKGITIPDDELPKVIRKTDNYSASNFSDLLSEMVASGSKSVLQTLEVWQAPTAIKEKRRLQSLIAAKNCSYPGLLTQDLRDKIASGEIDQEIQLLEATLFR